MKISLLSKFAVLSCGLLASLFCGEVATRLFWQEKQLSAGHDQGEFFKQIYLDIYRSAFESISVSGKPHYHFTRGIDMAFPKVFPKKKDKGTKRIFIIGESTAANFDVDILEDKLKDVLPQTKFEIINAGVVAYDSYRTSLIAKQILRYQPDLVVVIVGNNEFWVTRRVNPYRYRGLLSKFQITRMLTDFLNPDVRISNGREAQDYYLANMRRIIKAAKRRGVPLVLCTLPSNYRCSRFPEGSIFFEKEFFGALRNIESGRIERAKKILLALRGKHPNCHIDMALGQIAEGEGNFEQAAQYYRTALNEAKPPVTRSPLLNELTRTLCKQSGVILADIEKRFLATAPHGIPGYDLFMDNCHPWGEGYRLYADEIIEAVYQNNTETGSDLFAPKDQWRISDFERTDYDELRKLEKYPNPEKLATMSAFDISENGGRFTPHAVEYMKRLFMLQPEELKDPRALRSRIEKTYETTPGVQSIGWREQNLVWASLLYHAGEALRQAGETPLAMQYLNESITLYPHFFEAYVIRGLIHRSVGRQSQSKTDFDNAIRLNNSLDWLTAYGDRPQA